MKIKKNGFYLIKDEFFRKINDPSLPLQKNGRPMYYCIEDKNSKSIFWLIPMTTKIDKVNRIISQEGGEDKCKIYVINSSDKNSAFNIQDIFNCKAHNNRKIKSPKIKSYILHFLNTSSNLW